MKNIKIIVATHKKARMPEDNSLYVPLHVGAEGKESIGYIGDNTGENISKLNPYYCELTGLYWVWKNLDSDYLGLVHYRRYFSKNSQAYYPDIPMNDVILSKEELDKLLDSYDIIVPKKRKYYIETLYSHYANTFESSHLDIAKEIITRNTPEYISAFDFIMKSRSGYMFNMFIMKRELIDKYCQWLFPILDEMYKSIDLTNYNSFEARLFGRVSERLFNVWLHHHSMKVKEVPFIYMEKVNLRKKILAFLMAKFFRKKYQGSF